jgi:hypothetical protein
MTQLYVVRQCLSCTVQHLQSDAAAGQYMTEGLAAVAGPLTVMLIARNTHVTVASAVKSLCFVDVKPIGFIVLLKLCPLA